MEAVQQNAEKLKTKLRTYETIMTKMRDDHDSVVTAARRAEEEAATLKNELEELLELQELVSGTTSLVCAGNFFRFQTGWGTGCSSPMGTHFLVEKLSGGKPPEMHIHSL